MCSLCFFICLLCVFEVRLYFCICFVVCIRIKSPGHQIVVKEQAKQRRLFWRILNVLLCTIFDELIVVVGASVLPEIYRVCGSTMEHMKCGVFANDYESKYSERFSSTRITLRASASEDSADEVLVALKKIMKEHWDCSIDNQFKTTWSKVITYLLPSLPCEWSIAVQEDYVVSALKELAKTIPKNGKYQHGLKSVLPNVLARISVLVAIWKHLYGTFKDDIKNQIGTKGAWTPDTLLAVWNFIIFNWNKMIKPIYNPQTFVDSSAVQSSKLGLRMAEIGWYYLHCGVSIERFQNLENFVKSIVDVRYYNWDSQVKCIFIPRFISRCPEHERIIWNVRRNNDHISMKNNFYAVSMVNQILHHHRKDYESRMNTAVYKDNVGIDSQVVNQGSLAQSVGVAINNFQGSSNPFDSSTIASIHSIIDNLHNGKYGCEVQYNLGLCRKVTELAEEGICFDFFVLFFL